MRSSLSRLRRPGDGGHSDLGLYFGMLWGAGVHPLWAGGRGGRWGRSALSSSGPACRNISACAFKRQPGPRPRPLGQGLSAGEKSPGPRLREAHGTEATSRASRRKAPSPAALPARHTDFLFAAAGEELGLVGCLLILGLLSAIVFRCIWLAKTSRDPFLHPAVASGTAAMFATQTIF